MYTRQQQMGEWWNPGSWFDDTPNRPSFIGGIKTVTPEFVERNAAFVSGGLEGMWFVPESTAAVITAGGSKPSDVYIVLKAKHNSTPIAPEVRIGDRVAVVSTWGLPKFPEAELAVRALLERANKQVRLPSGETVTEAEKRRRNMQEQSRQADQADQRHREYMKKKAPGPFDPGWWGTLGTATKVGIVGIPVLLGAAVILGPVFFRPKLTTGPLKLGPVEFERRQSS